MKKINLILLLFVVLCVGCFLCRPDIPPIEDFYSDLASENNRINALLYLDEFDENLESLTYDYYIRYLRKNVMPSAKELPEKIQQADDYYFRVKKTSFMIILLYREEKILLGDIASTEFLDTLITIQSGEVTPDLTDVAEKLEF